MSVAHKLLEQVTWDEACGMGVHARKLFSCRKGPPPEWALNDKLLRQVIIRQMEMRAGLPAGAGLQAAQEEIQRQRPKQVEIFWTLNKRYVRLKNRKWPVSRKRLKRLVREIEGVDTFLRITNRGDGGAAIMASAVYLYYRMGLDSCEVGRELNLKPPHVRVLLHKLARISGKIPGTGGVENSC